MAKKYEFQPDKPYATWLSKLQLTKLQQKQVLKWTLYALILLILSVLQDVVLSRFRLFGATTDLIPCTIILICMIEGSHRGSLFALISGCLYLFSGSAAMVGTGQFPTTIVPAKSRHNALLFLFIKCFLLGLL